MSAIYIYLMRTASLGEARKDDKRFYHHDEVNDNKQILLFISTIASLSFQPVFLHKQPSLH